MSSSAPIGSHHLRQTDSDSELSVLKTAMNSNGEFAHHDNVLVSLLASYDIEERKVAINIIFQIREKEKVTQRWKTATGQRLF